MVYIIIPQEVLQKPKPSKWKKKSDWKSIIIIHHLNWLKYSTIHSLFIQTEKKTKVERYKA